MPSTRDIINGLFLHYLIFMITEKYIYVHTNNTIEESL
jgi:hypothetical protein